MILRPNYESMMPALLRVAPYIDIERLRKKMEDTSQYILDHRTHIPEVRKVMLEAFISGEGHIIPTSYGLTDTLYSVLRRMREENSPDGRLDDVYHEYSHYFFDSDETLGIGQ